MEEEANNMANVLAACMTSHRAPTDVVAFLPRTIRNWNSISKDTVEATTVDTFVSRASH